MNGRFLNIVMRIIGISLWVIISAICFFSKKWIWSNFSSRLNEQFLSTLVSRVVFCRDITKKISWKIPNPGAFAFIPGLKSSDSRHSGISGIFRSGPKLKIPIPNSRDRDWGFRKNPIPKPTLLVSILYKNDRHPELNSNFGCTRMRCGKSFANIFNLTV